jgi:hypothetical protein
MPIDLLHIRATCHQKAQEYWGFGGLAPSIRIGTRLTECGRYAWNAHELGRNLMLPVALRPANVFRCISLP